MFKNLLKKAKQIFVGLQINHDTIYHQITIHSEPKDFELTVAVYGFDGNKIKQGKVVWE